MSDPGVKVLNRYQLRMNEAGIALAFGSGPFIMVDDMSQVEAQEAAKALAEGMSVMTMAAGRPREADPPKARPFARALPLSVSCVFFALAAINLYWFWVDLVRLHLPPLAMANGSTAFAAGATGWLWSLFLKSREQRG